MAAYFVVEVHEVTDPALFDEYRREVGAVITRYGGRTVAAGRPDVLEGAWGAAAMAVIEFASMERLRAWYDSAEYAPLKALRRRSQRATVVALDGP